MISLEAQQRGLLNLVKRRGAPSDDPYLQRVAASPGLAIARETALFWRAFQIQDQCRFTARLLARLGSFDAFIETYFDSHATSPFVEELSRDFLRSLHTHEDALVQAVAQFEYAVLEVKSGSAEAFEVLWDRNPDLFFQALETHGELPAAEEGNLYKVQISRKLPGVIASTCERTSRQPNAAVAGAGVAGAAEPAAAGPAGGRAA